MEVAGFILGVLPMAIDAVDTCQPKLSSLKSAQRDLKDMKLNLETQQQILQNTCRILLKDIVPDSQVDAMIADPFGTAWKDYDEDINTRLHHSSSVFKLTVDAMREAVDELRQKLAVDEHSEATLTDRRSIIEGLKRNTREVSFTMSFTLRKKDYASILERLKSGNLALYTLASQNKDLEPTRRSGSQAQLVLMIRKLSQGMFIALQSVIGCKYKLHDLGLEIAPRKVKMATANEEQAARLLQFDIVLGGHGQGNAQHCDRIRILLAEKDIPPSPSESPSSPTIPPLTPRAKVPRRIRLTSLFTCDTSNEDSSAISVETQQSPTSDPIYNLRQLLKMRKGTSTNPRKRKIAPGQRVTTSDCYGFITDSSNKFHLYTHGSQPGNIATVDLEKILREQKVVTQRFGYLERLKVALALSSGILHHYNTPWLAGIVTMKHLVFIREDRAPNRHDYFLDTPFLAKQVSTSSSSAPPTSATGPRVAVTRPVNFTLLSLGFILIQAIFGRLVDELQIANDDNLDCLLKKQAAASDLNGSVEMLVEGGPNYRSVVQWCLTRFFDGRGFEDERFCHEYRGEVIARLEYDMKHQTAK
ncbi:hypothetical protein VPNG_04581 [Cytospora leucostoma]|uniref:DUF7580 domain-containing protein n=1 Tax=Cytospora leucostoma TaxID=1230097 RepID=A0A423XCA6_9PEZI|nr:hypothetical protein VPNG_04581 [Cytospora leucostoma]